MSEPKIFTPEQVAALRNWLSKVGLIERDEALRLCDTVKAQAEVIQRYKDGWEPSRGSHYAAPHWWRRHRNTPWRENRMSEAHQLLVYGEVVRSEP